METVPRPVRTGKDKTRLFCFALNRPLLSDPGLAAPGPVLRYAAT